MSTQCIFNVQQTTREPIENLDSFPCRSSLKCIFNPLKCVWLAW